MATRQNAMNDSWKLKMNTNPDCQLKMYPSFSSQYKLMMSPMHRKSLIAAAAAATATAMR
jgi:hypothetical protein